MILRDRLGHSLVVEVDAIEAELRDLVLAADEACGASTNEPELERLRFARERFMHALDRQCGDSMHKPAGKRWCECQHTLPYHNDLGECTAPDSPDLGQDCSCTQFREAE